MSASVLEFKRPLKPGDLVRLGLIGKIIYVVVKVDGRQVFGHLDDDKQKTTRLITNDYKKYENSLLPLRHLNGTKIA